LIEEVSADGLNAGTTRLRRYCVEWTGFSDRLEAHSQAVGTTRAHWFGIAQIIGT